MKDYTNVILSVKPCLAAASSAKTVSANYAAGFFRAARENKAGTMLIRQEKINIFFENETKEAFRTAFTFYTSGSKMATLEAIRF